MEPVFSSKASSQASTEKVQSKAEPPQSPVVIVPDEDTLDALDDSIQSCSDEYVEGSVDAADYNALSLPAQHKCFVCLRTYFSAVLLEKHKCPGRPEKKYTCHICFRELNREGHLVAHMRVHTGEKPFKCTVCSRAFRQKSNLTVHMRQHTTGGPFQCVACPRSFTRKDYLQTHMQRYHML
ncbi:zinc finger protein 1 homolog [Dermacentor silvarum]|uniref:zinc finger protein 1 homolog n=1 Tax=Dermacentor silvarum TaxID=543639 RepID=UPI0018982CCC|nr:zinc finger protein 1 homolog [Dermacentor silvarum]